ncbi:MAG TPA: hypothetical protein ENJ61_00260 [Aquifex aeolicus]|uniref:Pili assembly chaperone n=1 Tax=Aquifex aeolicus TaxID=63363 RepID=A0A7C5Q6Y8_AQUAO|nr:hypothetical protein [Aquifex aeolicus]
MRLSGQEAALALFMLFLAGTAFAGTGGAELSPIWDEISQGLQGFWGKIVAAAMVGLSIWIAKEGRYISALAVFIMGMVIGFIPGIVDSRYALTFLGT